MTDFVHISELIWLPKGILTGEFWIVWKIASSIGLTNGTGGVTPNIRTSKWFALDARSLLSFTTARQVLLLLQSVHIRSVNLKISGWWIQSARDRQINEDFSPSKVICNQKQRWHGCHEVTGTATCTLSFQLLYCEKDKSIRSSFLESDLTYRSYVDWNARIPEGRSLRQALKRSTNWSTRVLW